jgi:hypothetical protein
MDEAQAKARLLAAFTRLRDEIWQRANEAGPLSEPSRRVIEQTLEKLRQDIEADPAWLEQVLKDFEVDRRTPEDGS